MAAYPVEWWDTELHPLETVAGGAGDPDPWDAGELTDTAAEAGALEEGEEPPPVPPDQPTPWASAELTAAGGGTCCCPVPPPTVCYCPTADALCVATSGFPTTIPYGLGDPATINRTRTYYWTPAGYPYGAIYNWWASSPPDTNTQTTTGTVSCAVPPGASPVVYSNIDYWAVGPLGYTGAGAGPFPGSTVVGCTQRDGGDDYPNPPTWPPYTYYAGTHSFARTTVTGCSCNCFPGAPPTCGCNYTYDIERWTLFAGWDTASLLATPWPGGVYVIYNVNSFGSRPPRPTLVSCTATVTEITSPWVIQHYKITGITKRTGFTAPTSPPESDGTMAFNNITTGTGNVVITKFPCPMAGARPAPPPLHPEAARLMAADPLLRPGCCG